MTIIGTPSLRRCSYATGPIIGHYVKQRCHPSTPKKSAWEPFLISHRVRLFLGRRESGKAKNLQTVRQMPKQLTDKSLYTKPMASPPMGGSRSCQRQTCTASRTVSGLAVLKSLCGSFLAAGWSRTASAFLSFKRCRVRSIPKASNPQPWMAVPNPSHWQAQSRPSVSIGATSAQPQIAIRASSHPKPSAFHSHVSTCQPTVLS